MRPQRRLGRQVKALLRGAAQSFRQAVRRDLHHGEPRPRRRYLQHLLARHPERVREDGAQALVPRHQVAQRQLQCGHIKLARQPHRQRDRVGRARAFQPVEEPQPALRKRQRHLGRPRPSPAAAPAPPSPPRAAAPASRRSGPRTGCGSRSRHRAWRGCARSAASPARSARRVRRSCRRCRPRKPQRLGKQTAQHLLVRRARQTPQRRHRRLRRRQRPPVELAVRRQRQTIQQHERLRHHVVRQQPDDKMTRASSPHPEPTRRPSPPHTPPDAANRRRCRRPRCWPW